MSTPVYLAGPSSELERVTRFASKLEESGLVRLAFKWWVDMEKDASRGLSDKEMPRDEQAIRANRDLDGLSEAEIVWCLWPTRFSEGTCVELGYALCHHAPWAGRFTVVTGERSHECIFTALADFRDASDEVGLHEVLRLARKLEGI